MTKFFPREILDSSGLDADRLQVRESLIGIRYDDLDRVLLARLEINAEAGAEGDGACRPRRGYLQEA